MQTIRRTRSAGFSVVELLVAMALSLVLLAGVMTLFANSRTAYESNERVARIQENGRFALEQIVRDVRAAGYSGCSKRIATKPLKNILNTPTSLLWNFAVPVQGFNGASGVWTPALTAPASTDLPDSDTTGPDVDGPTPNTDVLVIRRVRPDVTSQRVKVSMSSGTASIQTWTPSTLAAGDVVLATSCDGASVFQITAHTVNSGTQTATIEHAAATAHTPGNSSADVGNLFFQEIAEVVPIETVVYFIDRSTSGVGTSLYRRVGNTAPQEVVEGVDSLQLQFGVDTNGDSNHLADSYVVADTTTNWDRVVSVRVGLLVRSMEEYGSQTDTTSHTVLGVSVPAFNDRRERRVFTTTATLRNKLF